ncbi:MAG: MFS transporter, partial [Clostridia bacterium]
LVSGLTAIGIGASSVFAVTLVLQFFNGLFFPCIHIGLNTMILKGTEESFIGRVNGVLNPIFMGMMVLTMSMAGWLKSTFGLVTMYETAGVLFLISMLLLVPLFKIKVEEAPKPETQS